MASKTKRRYDVAVLGGGPGGYAAALRAAQRGAGVCCIEAHELGGTCLNVGCIPTKAMLHASRLAWEMSKAGQFGLSSGPVSIDGAALMRRTEKVVAGLRRGIAQLLAARKVDVIRGRGRLTAKDGIAVESEGGTLDIAAGTIIIATGSAAMRPAAFNFDSPNVITTDEAVTADDLPESVVVIGGGVIGCEFATIYAELGIETTVVEMLDKLVAPLGAEASTAVTRSLKRRGAKILTAATVTDIESADGGMVCTLEGGEKIRAHKALVAIGRQPNVEGIGLQRLGIHLAGGVIVVDDRCRTSVQGVYAVGDVAEKRQYAHLATRMGIVAADNATGHDARDDRSVVPSGLYTHPQVARVGLTEQQAREANLDVRIGSFPYRASGMAHACSELDGAVKLIAEDKTQRLLGALIIGPNALEIIGQVSLAMRCGASVRDIARTIHAHPTFAEAIGEAAEAWGGLPIHVLG